MTIRTQQSISGFIANDPVLTETDTGETRFYARFGQENYRREEDGTFTKLEPSFHNLVMFRATAERAYERFSKGDSFVAEGYTHEYTYERAGQRIEGEEFVAKKIGHDTARTSYEVDRTPRAAADAPTRAPSRVFESPQQRPGTDAPTLGR
mgnify:CR=1 FL=1